MDLLLTGATGFVGSHMVLRWLHRHPAARVGCLVRAHDTTEAQLRLRAALDRAAANEGTSFDGQSAQVAAIPGTMDDPAWIDRARAWLRGSTELIHCAANISFREVNRAAVLRTNVDGTASLLTALPSLPGITAFNYISTAYVAGDRQGQILETERVRPLRFNNPYEESKWIAEGNVQQSCASAGMPWRIMRPSIVIAHSATRRTSSQSGFYQVIDTLLQLGRQERAAGGQPILLPVMEGTVLDLIPVDVVVDEVVALASAGATTAGCIFHITTADPLQLAEVLRALTPMNGIAIAVNDPDTPLTSVAKLVMRGLHHYTPYFAYARQFDRRGTQAALGSVPCHISVEQLRAFVCSYLEQKPEAHRPRIAV